MTEFGSTVKCEFSHAENITCHMLAYPEYDTLCPLVFRMKKELKLSSDLGSFRKYRFTMMPVFELRNIFFYNKELFFFLVDLSQALHFVNERHKIRV